MSFRSLAFGDLDEELAATRRVLERVPEEHLAWKPHEKSFSLGELATHIANLTRWQGSILRQDEFDFALAPPMLRAVGSREELLRMFDEGVTDYRTALGEADDAGMEQPWTLRHGQHVIFSRPRAVVLRSFGLSHMAHHRGQLTVYLRLLGIPVPSVYGPTADERR